MIKSMAKNDNSVCLSVNTECFGGGGVGVGSYIK